MAAPSPISDNDEWLEADGLGGFASGTTSLIRTRRYHALLLTATTPPTGRFVLVNGFDAWVESRAGTFAISSQRYTPDVIHPDGVRRIETFEADPWPTWTFRLEDGTRIKQSLFVPHGRPMVVVTWQLHEAREPATLVVRPFLSGRDYHTLHREHWGFQFDAQADTGPASTGERLTWSPHPGVPAVTAITNGHYTHDPQWYRNFQYNEERARGLDFVEDLASPGTFRWDLTHGEAVWVLAAGDALPAVPSEGGSACAFVEKLRDSERWRRQRFASRLHRAADAYIVSRGRGKTIVAGYPWFTDWGRDTFISLRGLCLAAGRLDDAREILIEWAGTVSDGMLPNRFPDHGESPEFNSVDASLWYVVAVYEFLQAIGAGRSLLTSSARHALIATVEQILTGYARGTRYHIRCDNDGLLAAGQAGVQLTWTDAKVGDWVVTPRIGKPVEVQALWLNALWIGSQLGMNPGRRWTELFERGRESFRSRFWNEQCGCLYDVIDVDHQHGVVDAAFRPNQIFAVGGLPLALLEGERARRVVDAVESRLWTPLGLRSLAPGSPGYSARYEGGVLQRDGAYHEGTVWPWLIGPFVEAWVRVRGGSAEAKQQARNRFVQPLVRHLDSAGLGHVSEIADAEPPHTPRGCPFQAWSVGEVLRLVHNDLG